MFLVNEHIKRKVINEYRGSEQKETIYLDNGKKYMIKKPDPTREVAKRDDLSYINNVFSEYIGCHIAQMLGFQAQSTILGEYKTLSRKGEEKQKIVCLCEDVRLNGEIMYEFDTIALSTDINKNIITFPEVEDVIMHIEELLELDPKDTQSIRDFYYNLFILDAFIGNTDRHNGNIALLIKEDGTFSRISPVYDCGSSLLPLVGDDELNKKDIHNLVLSVYSIIHDSNGRRIQYKEYLEHISNPNIDAALLRVFPKINMNEIKDFIQRTDYITDARKQFYCDFLQQRYERVLLPALERIFPFQEADISDETDLYQIYKNNIRQVAELPLFTNSSIAIGNIDLNVIRISKKYAIILTDGECSALLPIRSNNSEIRRAIDVLERLNVCLEDMRYIDLGDYEGEER